MSADTPGNPCRKCGAQRKPGAQCAACMAARGKAWRLANLEKVKALSRTYYLENRGKIIARAKAWAAANLERTRASHHAAYLANIEKVRANSKARRQANPALFREYGKRYRAKHPEREKEHIWKCYLGRYGLTDADYRAKLLAQGNACKICKTLTPGKRKWHIDHDHNCCPGSGSCGRCVRGLLCHNCNLMLGHAGDNPEVLRLAIEYLSAPRLRAVK